MSVSRREGHDMCIFRRATPQTHPHGKTKPPNHTPTIKGYTSCKMKTSFLFEKCTTNPFILNQLLVLPNFQGAHPLTKIFPRTINIIEHSLLFSWVEPNHGNIHSQKLNPRKKIDSPKKVTTPTCHMTSHSIPQGSPLTHLP